MGDKARMDNFDRLAIVVYGMGLPMMLYLEYRHVSAWLVLAYMVAMAIVCSLVISR